MKKKAEKIKNLYFNKDTFIMSNAWSVDSAILIEEQGFQAIATTSAGFAFSNRLPFKNI